MESICERWVVDYKAKNIFGKTARTKEFFNDEEKAKEFAMQIIRKEQETNGKDAFLFSWYPVGQQ